MPASDDASGTATGDRQATVTSSFGVSRRENHDSSPFYERFRTPEVSSDDTVGTTAEVDLVIDGDSRQMDAVADGSVALVVTSPPYFAGKDYELALGDGHVPADYVEYLEMLTAVFAECVDKLEPGGRLAVNVANLGRKPYRSLSADVITILQDELRLLLRGEIVWAKGRGATGSCAWGSFQQPGNPVLRDLTERVIVASKGRFDRALRPADRADRGMPSRATVTKDEFMDATLDVWEIPAESATRVGHPAPFPVELPQRLIELNTYAGDLVLDPFLGSGTTGVAAARTGRHYIGYETDPAYAQAARDRIALEVAARPALGDDPAVTPRSADGGRGAADEVAEAIAMGAQAAEVAESLVRAAGFERVTVPRRGVRVGGATVGIEGFDPAGRRWLFDVAGGRTTGASGLRRAEVLWRVLATSAVIAAVDPEAGYVVLTTELPSATHRPALAAVVEGGGIDEVVELLDPEAVTRLRAVAAGTTA